MEAGLPQPAVDDVEGGEQQVEAGGSPLLVASDVEGDAGDEHVEDTMTCDELRAAVTAAKAERENLASEAERHALESELAEIKRQSQELRSKLTRDPPPQLASRTKATRVTTADLRAIPAVSSKAEARLAELGISDSDSSSSSEEDDRRRRRGAHGALIYKRDLRRAYRQFPVDPFDYPLLGYRWNDELYFDVVLPMGLRSAAMACQRITNAVCFICRSERHGIISYLDDFIGVSEPASAWKSFNYCGSILEELGLEESLNKVCEPATVVTCLGVQFDTTQMTMSVTPQRLAEIEALLVSWLTKKTATKADLQSLVGKLSFVSKCVRQSRLFLSRILAVLCTLKRNHHRTRLTREFRRDLTWWLRFLRTYNGVSLIRSSPWSAPDIVFSTDACLTGCGGVSHSQYFHATFPAEAQSQFADIHRLEALAILVALRLWGHSWTGLRIQVFCDNQAVVSALSSGKVKDQLLAACLRDIWYIAATYDFEIRAVYLTSGDNRVADLLSRWHLGPKFREDFEQLLVTQALTERSYVTP
ncbi:hypothetical protein QZH41_003891 [Actinostola sp. cb2023]|nr:hypothetical protein QZH41_003891 [Actinostola sp. cb2023]